GPLPAALPWPRSHPPTVRCAAGRVHPCCAVPARAVPDATRGTGSGDRHHAAPVQKAPVPARPSPARCAAGRVRRPLRAGPVRSRGGPHGPRSEEHTSELQSRENLVCRLLLEKKKETQTKYTRTETQTQY